MDEGQIATFQRDGYLLLRGFFNLEEVVEITRWTEELASAPEEVGRHWVYREASLLDPEARIIQRIENFCPFHEGFDRLVRHGRLMETVSRLFGEQAILFKEKINFKMPGEPVSRRIRTSRPVGAPTRPCSSRRWSGSTPRRLRTAVWKWRRDGTSGACWARSGSRWTTSG